MLDKKGFLRVAKLYSWCLNRHPKYHLRTPGFTLFVFQVNDLNCDPAFETDVEQSAIVNETLFELILPEENQ